MGGGESDAVAVVCRRRPRRSEAARSRVASTSRDPAASCSSDAVDLQLPSVDLFSADEADVARLVRCLEGAGQRGHARSNERMRSRLPGRKAARDAEPRDWFRREAATRRDLPGIGPLSRPFLAVASFSAPRGGGAASSSGSRRARSPRAGGPPRGSRSARREMQIGLRPCHDVVEPAAAAKAAWAVAPTAGGRQWPDQLGRRCSSVLIRLRQLDARGAGFLPLEDLLQPGEAAWEMRLAIVPADLERGADGLVALVARENRSRISRQFSVSSAIASCTAKASSMVSMASSTPPGSASGSTISCASLSGGDDAEAA